jgi:DNA-binding NarL/FixJ family response regulator
MQVKNQILIVDDDPDFFHGLVEELEARDCVVSSAENLKDARMLVKEHQLKFDVILVDLRFGENGSGKQGLSFISWLRAQDIDSRIIVVTIHQGYETVYIALKEKRVDDYFFKSKYDIDIWVEKILNLIRIPKELSASFRSRADNNYSTSLNLSIEDRSLSLLRLGKITETINLLRVHPLLEDDDERLLDQQESRWEKLQQDNSKGIIRKSDADLEYNNITNNLFGLISRLLDKNQQPPEQNSSGH